MSNIVVEIRAAEGGADAKDLVSEQFAIYANRCGRLGLDAEIVDQRPGMLVFEVRGKGASKAFGDEAGGHRWQRVPPTEKRGRVQTSTVTVAVLPQPTETQLTLRDSDLEWKSCRGSGAGGQKRNVTDSAIQLTHLPTGLQVRAESERSQPQNRRMALATLRARLWAAQEAAGHEKRASNRKAQVGSGMRGDKRRTIRVRDGRVHDHVTGRRWNLRDYLRGDW